VGSLKYCCWDAAVSQKIRFVVETKAQTTVITVASDYCGGFPAARVLRGNSQAGGRKTGCKAIRRSYHDE
jgi:hypothetical protein